LKAAKARRQEADRIEVLDRLVPMVRECTAFSASC
jgi:hypothetical protein